MTDEEIAKGLTEAQREALLAMPMARPFETVNGVRMIDQWVRPCDIGVSGQTLMSMNGLGGANPVTLELGPILVTPSDMPTRGARLEWAITPRGLAVRAILQEQSNGTV